MDESEFTPNAPIHVNTQARLLQANEVGKERRKHERARRQITNGNVRRISEERKALLHQEDNRYNLWNTARVKDPIAATNKKIEQLGKKAERKAKKLRDLEFENDITEIYNPEEKLDTSNLEHELEELRKGKNDAIYTKRIMRKRTRKDVRDSKLVQTFGGLKIDPVLKNINEMAPISPVNEEIAPVGDVNPFHGVHRDKPRPVHIVVDVRRVANTFRAPQLQTIKEVEFEDLSKLETRVMLKKLAGMRQRLRVITSASVRENIENKKNRYIKELKRRNAIMTTQSGVFNVDVGPAQYKVEAEVKEDSWWIDILDMLNPMGNHSDCVKGIIPFVTFLHHVCSSPTIEGMWLAASQLGRAMEVGAESFKELILFMKDKLSVCFTYIRDLVRNMGKTEAWSDSVDDVKSIFSLVMSSSVVTVVRDFFLMLCSYKMFDTNVISTARSLFGQLPKMTLSSLVEQCLDAIKLLLRFAEALFLGLPIHEILFADNPIQLFLSASAKLLYFKDKLYSGLPVSGHMEEGVFHAECEKLIIHGEHILKVANKLTTPMGEIHKQVLALREAKFSVEQGSGKNTPRMVPMSIVIFGAPGLGKGSLLPFICSLFYKVMGLKWDYGCVYSYVMSSPFWENYNPYSHRIIHFSELGTTAESITKCRGDPILEIFTSLVDSIPMCVNTAFGDKGKIYAEPWLVISDTNKEDLGAAAVKNNPAAILRRSIFLEPIVKEEFRIDGTMSLDSAKALAAPGHKLDRYWFRLYKVYAVDNTHTKEVSIMDGLPGDDITKLANTLFDMMKEHILIQAKIKQEVLSNMDIDSLLSEEHLNMSVPMPENFSDIAPKNVEENFNFVRKENAITFEEAVNQMKERICLPGTNVRILSPSDVKYMSGLKEMETKEEPLILEKDNYGPTYDRSKDLKQRMAAGYTFREASDAVAERLKENKKWMINNPQSVMVTEAGLAEVLDEVSNYAYIVKDTAVRVGTEVALFVDNPIYRLSRYIACTSILTMLALLLSITDLLCQKLHRQYPRIYRFLYLLCIMSVWYGCYYNDKFILFMMAILYSYAYLVNITNDIMSRSMRLQFRRFKLQTYHAIRNTFNFNNSRLYVSNWWDINKVKVKASLALLTTSILVVLGVVALKSKTTEIFTRKKKEKPAPISPMPIQTEAASELKIQSAFNEEINAMEEKANCGSSYKRVPIKGAQIWNEQKNVLPTPKHTDSSFSLQSSVNKNVRLVKVLDRTNIVTFGIGLMSNVMMINTHALGTVETKIAICHSHDYQRDNVSWRETVVNALNRIDLDNDVTLIIVQGFMFRSIVSHIGEFSQIEQTFNGRFRELELRASRSFEPRIAQDVRSDYLSGEDFWVYKYPGHKSGMCGLPLILDIPGGAVLAGIHFAGGQDDTACAVVLSKADIMVAIDKLQDKHGMLPLCSESAVFVFDEVEDPISKSIFNYEPMAGVEYYGKYPGNVIVNQTSKLVSTGLKDSVSSLLAETIGYTPSVEYGKPLMKPGKIHGEWISPWNVGLKKLAGSRTGLNPYIMEKCVREYMKRLKKGLAHLKGKISPLNMETAINATREDGYLRRINATTAAGLGYRGAKSTWMPIVEESMEEIIREPDEKIKADIMKMFEYVARGEAIPCVVKASLKDEPRSLEKVAQGKTRIFYGSVLPHLILCRMFLAPLYTLMVQFGDLFCTAVGVNIFTGAKGIYEDLAAFSDKIMEGDYGMYDINMPPGISLMANTILYQLAEFLGYNTFALAVLRSLLSGMSFPILVALLDIICAPIQPSGKYGTAEDNSLRGVLLLMYFYYKCYTVEEGEFFDNVLPKTYGDDMLAAVKALIAHWFNSSNYALFCENNYNMTFTTSSKRKIDSDFVDLDKMTFLKRSFVHRDNTIIAPLEKDSLVKMMSWRMPSDHVDKASQMISTFESFCWELTLHTNKEQYDYISGALAKEVSKKFLCGEPLEVKDYHSILTQMME